MISYTCRKKWWLLASPFNRCLWPVRQWPAWRCGDASRVRSSTLRREIDVSPIFGERKKQINGSGLVSNGPSLAIFLRMQPPFLFGWEQLRSNLYTGKRKMWCICEGHQCHQWRIWANSWCHFRVVLQRFSPFLTWQGKKGPFFMSKLCENPWPSPGTLVDRFCFVPVRGLFSVVSAFEHSSMSSCLAHLDVHHDLNIISATRAVILPLSASPWAIKTQQNNTGNECEGSCEHEWSLEV